ncbi:hypothetical protein HDU84_001510 [Entophlyctis sp. JEL0112]|nr:hypothetical protein HDU84_001510 [Entophlyctis sp. JEL0112]
MIFYFAVGVFFLHVGHCMDAGSSTGTRISCVDSITEASSYNSVACTIQGFLINFSAIYLSSWIGLFKLNLFATLTWRVDWFSDKYIYLHAGTLLVSLAPTIALLAVEGVGSVGFFCIFDVRHSGYFVWPMGLIGWTNCLITFSTCVQLIGMLLSAPETGYKTTSKKSGGLMKSAGSQADLARSMEFNDLPPLNIGASRENLPQFHPISPKKDIKAKSALSLNTVKKASKKFLDVWYKSWRSLAICVSFMFIFGTFWIVEVVAVELLLDVDSTTPWVVTWFACGLAGSTQAQCADLAAPYTPSLGALAAANLSVRLVGIVIFTIFAPQTTHDWRALIQKSRK